MEEDIKDNNIHINNDFNNIEIDLVLEKMILK